MTTILGDESSHTPLVLPRIGGLPIVGILPRLMRDPLRTLQTTVKDGGIAKLGWLGKDFFLVSHPEHVKHVLQDNYKQYHRGLHAPSLDMILGNGIFLAEGKSWLRQRRMMAPMFHQRQISVFPQIMGDIVRAHLARDWTKAAAEERAIDLEAELLRITRQIIVKTMFGADLTPQAQQESSEALAVVIGYVELISAAALPLWLPLRRNVEFKKAVHTLERLVYGFIRERRRQGPKDSDLLDLLLSARDDNGEALTDVDIRDQVMSIFVAGHVTVASSLTWAFYLLSQNPAIEAKLRDEVCAVLGDRPPAWEDLPKLKYTRMVFEETMRLYPPAWLLDRSPIDDDAIGGYRIGKGSLVFYSPYMTHRHPEFWERPDVFDPERFTSERSEKRSKFSYIPFGGGPRVCIGNGFALVEAQIVLATIVQRYMLQPVPGHPVVLQARASLSTRYGLRMTIVPRA